MSPNTLLSIFAILLGLGIGSFLNVCIHRLPLGKSLGGRSICPHCGKLIAWYFNLPLLSYFLLGGRSACCKKPISWRYPAVEGMTAILSLLIMKHEGFDLVPYLIWFLLFASPLIVVTWIDFAYKIIPDLISLPGILAGFLSMVLLRWPDWTEAVSFSLLGVAAGGLSLLILGYLYLFLRKREGMGGGDVKLAAMIGAFLGWQGVIFVFLISSLLAIIFALASLPFKNEKNNPIIIPYGPFLSSASVIFYFLGDEIMQLYFSTLL